MCGICGFTGDGDEGVLRRMTDVLEHRGPDDKGYYSGGGVSLGHRRLSIIDLSEKGRQPMSNEDETVWVVYNGEVYNFQELKKGLEQRGHKFKSHTDTEVLVHLYEEKGDALVDELRGMFAFAIWDVKRKKILLARDRIGKKPLYYTVVNNQIVFASEIKSVIQHPNVERKVNKNALHNFMSLRFVPGPETMFEGIYRLQPGHVLTFSNGRAETKEYWNVQLKPIEKSESYFVNELYRLTEESVRIRLMSDVPLGVFLSGGVDSSFVTALMSNMVKEPVKTFSVGFGGAHDERGKAREVAEHYGTDHKEVVVDLKSMNVLPEITWHSDEPVGDTANIPIYYVSKLARDNNVPVILCGDGPDELYAGYEHVKLMRMLGCYRSIVPKALNGLVFSAVRATPKPVLNNMFRYAGQLGEEGLKRFKDVIDTVDDCERYMKLVSVVTENEKESLYTSEVKEKSKLVSWAKENYFNKGTIMDQMLLFDIKATLPDDFLMKADKMTMAHSIECREPHLDQRIVELTTRMPDNLKLHMLKDKYVFRKAARKILPKNIAERKKQRFFVPIDEWFSGENKGIIEGILYKSRLFRRDYVKKALEGYESSRLYYMRQLWNMTAFEVWNRIYIESEDVFRPKLDIDYLTQG
ncbi:MAG: asparagine synthase (glutamine-hydrolyzing) [Candidatus Altiarchaeota archaeon]|nr:asparagine synthase (glutamine-hydrolyzing) [Candidatus Altiarchaeota archaeon]